MSSVLITAFGPYEEWPENASWLTLMELTRDLPKDWPITTRLYPVDFEEVQKRLETDMASEPDVVLLMGQAPGSSCIQLESFAINVGGMPSQPPDQHRSLVDDGPAAFRSGLPLADWAQALREQDIPAQVSHHAGTYLCNASMYFVHFIAQRQGLKTQAAFLHLPLDVSQAVKLGRPISSLPVAVSARAVRLLLEKIFSEQRV